MDAIDAYIAIAGMLALALLIGIIWATIRLWSR